MIYRIPVMFYAISAGPLARTNTREAVRDALNQSAVISVTRPKRIGCSKMSA